MIVNGMYADEKGVAIDTFHLEQKIFQAWNLVDDLKLLMNSLEYMSEDETANAVLGLEAIAEMRFKDLFETFEQCVKNGALDDQSRYTICHNEDVAKAFESLRKKKA